MSSWRQFVNSAVLAAAAIVWLGGVRVFGADPASKTAAPDVPEVSPLSLEPVYHLRPVNGKQRLATRGEVELGKLQPQLQGVAFLALCTNRWPAGLVPLFMVEKTNGFELRRQPPRGQENGFEPLFFAWPLADEPDASKLAGYWECRAIRGSGAKEWLAWELTVEADRVSGRFDQNTQYRYAFIMGGTFRSNRLDLRVEYLSDVYLLSGEWRDGKLKGEWRQAEDAEHGTWEASRGETELPPSKDSLAVVPLYEWRRMTDGSRRYAVEGQPMEAGWTRLPRPLCRVWQQPIQNEQIKN